MTEVIKAVVDDKHFFEVQPDFAKNIVCGFARLGGQSVGIVANNPRHMAGTLNIDASDKASRFIRTCDCFNVPILTFVDVTGFLPGVAQEHAGIIRHGAKMLYAYAEATVPKITLIVRKSYGGAYLAMNSRDMGADVVLAWPTSAVAVMGAEGAANIIYRREIWLLSSLTQPGLLAFRSTKSALTTPIGRRGAATLTMSLIPKTRANSLCGTCGCWRGKSRSGPLRSMGILPL